ncbi:hypothetical protein HJFPF1_02526 [Paramyrothecium foliicola]|nr:hypothetical protein HJFPF1_02526 [Paramyrothecium foliicola]
METLNFAQCIDAVALPLGRTRQRRLRIRQQKQRVDYALASPIDVFFRDTRLCMMKFKRNLEAEGGNV